MKLTDLLNELGEYPIQMLQRAKETVYVNGCKLLSPEQTAFSPEVIYFAATTRLPPLPADTMITFLFREQAHIPEAYRDAKHVTLLLPGADIDADILYNQINEHLFEDSLLVRSTQRMLDALFTGLGLQYLINVAYEILGHPIYVVDNSYRYLAFSQRGDAGKVDSPVLLEENKLGHIIDAGVRQIKKARLDEMIRKSPRPFYYDNAVLGGGTLIDLIIIHNVEVGHIMMYEMDKPFTHFDRVLLNRLSQMVALELQKNDFFKHNRGVMYSYFLADLLDNHISSYQSISKRLQVLGYTLKEKLYVMVVHSRNERGNDKRLEAVANQIHWLLVGSMYVIYQGGIVLLISRSSDGITDYEYEETTRYLQETNLIAGLSNCFNDIQQIQRYYGQAVAAAKLGEKLSGTPAIYSYDDLSLAHMLSICEKDNDLSNFCHPSLLDLVEYDREKNSDFTDTLYQYLLCSQSSAKAAAKLNIHKNTLLYRIGKIKKILGSPLDDGEELMQLHISYHILRYLKQI